MLDLQCVGLLEKAGETVDALAVVRGESEEGTGILSKLSAQIFVALVGVRNADGGGHACD